jgi:hypothetical protein
VPCIIFPCISHTFFADEYQSEGIPFYRSKEIIEKQKEAKSIKENIKKQKKTKNIKENIKKVKNINKIEKNIKKKTKKS